MKKTIFCVIALGMSVATVYGQDEVTAINTGAANFLTIMPDARTAALAGAGIEIVLITTSDLDISLLIRQQDEDAALEALHKAFAV